VKLYGFDSFTPPPPPRSFQSFQKSGMFLVNILMEFIFKMAILCFYGQFLFVCGMVKTFAIWLQKCRIWVEDLPEQNVFH
jgi:hypothetical protein